MRSKEEMLEFLDKIITNANGVAGLSVRDAPFLNRLTVLYLSTLGADVASLAKLLKEHIESNEI